MESEIISRLLKRRPDSHKYDYGHVLVVGGSPGMVGAPLLAGMASLRSGAGLVTIASPAAVTEKLERRVKEIMTFALPADLGSFVRDRKVSAAVVGPGLKPDKEAAGWLETLRAAGVTLIIDGGGLGLIKDQVPEGAILTPHMGEFKRLYGKDLPTQKTGIKAVASKFSKDHGVILVLKGWPTYVVQPDGSLHENSTGNAGLATAGTGDVLSGVIAGFIAQGVPPAEAAQAGVYLHGLAGDIAAVSKTQPGMVAGDVIEALPAAFKRAREDA